MTSEEIVCVRCAHPPRFYVTHNNLHIPVCGRHLPRVYLDQPAESRDFYPTRTDSVEHS